MTYEEFKKQGYTIESVHSAMIWHEVTIHDSGSYEYRQIDELDYGEPDIYRIIPLGNNDAHAYEEFYDLGELEEYIKNDM